MSPLRVGLTGGIGAGKSTVGGWMREAGFRVVDADRLVAELYRADGAGAAVVRRLFGPDLLQADGSVDPRRLAGRIFADAGDRRRLEEAVHPLVRREFAAIAAATPGVIVLEAPLLVEAGFAGDFDVVVTIEAEPRLRQQRAVDRGLEPVDVARRLAAQSAAATRIAAADVVLSNNGTLDELRHEVDELIESLKRRARHLP